MDKIQNIPLHDIETTALPRDRTLIDTTALNELTASIRTNGLRLPIEVYPTQNTFALIAGFRRHLAFQTLAKTDETFTKIPAFIRTPKSTPAAMAAMIEENEMRQSLSPWERAHIVVRACDMGTFDTYDAALNTLFPHANRQKRARLRAIADVVDIFQNTLIDPECLSERQLMRLSTAIRHGWADIILTALNEITAKDHLRQWSQILPTLTELENLLTTNQSTNPTRPRRLSRPKSGINVRRERLDNGYALFITGHKANGALMTSLIEEIELQLSSD